MLSTKIPEIHLEKFQKKNNLKQKKNSIKCVDGIIMVAMLFNVILDDDDDDDNNRYDDRHHHQQSITSKIISFKITISFYSLT